VEADLACLARLDYQKLETHLNDDDDDDDSDYMIGKLEHIIYK
jgi:hypothetical protein